MNSSILLTIFIIISSLALIFSVLGFIMACYATLKILAVEKSTHSVHFAPVDKLEDWSAVDKDLDKLNKMNKDDVDFDFKNLGI